MSDCMSHPPPLQGYDATAIILYGAELTGILPFGYNIEMHVQGRSGLNLTVVNPVSAPTLLHLAVIYGYAFEGTCYKLDKPKIMVVDGSGFDAMGCEYNDNELGFPASPASLPSGFSRYRMWKVDKLRRSVAIEVTHGYFEQLVLEENLPGQRSPNTYRSHAMLSHRGGRLSE
jgi:hypothetical protein